MRDHPRETSRRKPGGHDERIAQRIRAAMLYNGIARPVELARRLGVKPPTVTNWLRSKTVPDTTRLESLAAVLHVTPEFIARGVIPGQAEAGVLDRKIGELLGKVGPAGLDLLAAAPAEELAAFLARIAERARGARIERDPQTSGDD